MFENFYEFFSVDKPDVELKNEKEFIEYFQGKSFMNGLFRLHNIANVAKWNTIITDAFPEVKNSIECFGYDWLGRQFAVYNETKTVLIFEPGTGFALDTEKTLNEFISDEITIDGGAALCFDFFQNWKEHNSNEIGLGECVGYKVPLFLGGDDDINNLEISDMEVYWGICGQIITNL